MVRLAEEAVARNPRHPEPYVLRAKAYGAVHRFADALEDLERARARGALASDLSSQRATLLMGLGRLDEACPMLTARRQRRASYVNLMLEAMCLGKMSRFVDADARFAQALDAYRDVSPFILGWMHFERGAMWDRAGRADKARAYYDAAVKRMPVYAHAAGHLAYMLPKGEARPLLERVIETSDDPEYLAALAHVAGEPTLDDAKRGYAALMQRQPLAFADHAGWFYLVVADDPERAIEAAELNLDNRPTAEAYELMISAQITAGDVIEACDTAEAGLALRHGSRGLLEKATRALSRCGRSDAASEVAERLRAHDANVARL